VSEPSHEFREGGAGLGRKDGPGVTQVVEMEVRPAGCGTCLVEGLTESAGVHMPAGQRGEKQGISARLGELLQVIPDVREDMRRDVHVSHSGLGLGRSNGGLAIRPRHAAADSDQSLAEINVPSPQLSDLAVLEGTPGAEQDRQAEPLG